MSDQTTNPEEEKQEPVKPLEEQSPTDATEREPSASEPVAETPDKKSATTAEKPQEQVEADKDAKTATEPHDEEEVSSSDDEEHDAGDDEDKSIDYHDLSQKELVESFEKLLKSEPVQRIKEEVQEIKSEFDAQFDEELQEKKEAFLAEGGNVIDFSYASNLKNKFDSLYFEYKEKRNSYYKNLKKDLQANLKKRLELIEELKGLIDVEENINTTYKHFKDIQERWREAGPIPRDGYNTVWNTYHHHVENFYDFLHLNREFRDLDFKHNLEEKLKVIARAEELATEENISKAFRELQMLHKMWKEEIGPVAKEHRDEVWERFSAATKVIHDRRAAHQKELESKYEENLAVKNEIIKQIEALTEQTDNTHKAWQQGIKKMEALREAFFKAGKVPYKETNDNWTAFKKAVRNFNRTKNKFYKQQKQEQYDNLKKKRELIQIAEENKDSDDFDVVTPLMKKIQSEWKHIGHVPRKYSDKIWKEFKAACNHYFDRFHANRNKASEAEVEALEKKTGILDQLSSFAITEDTPTDLENIKALISEWKATGKVPFHKKNIENKFNKIIDDLFKKLNVKKKDAEMIKYDNKLNNLDDRKIKNEHFFITKKIDEKKDAIRQLENNLGFFQHVDDDNPMVKEVKNNIKKHKEELELWKEKLKKLKSVI